MKLKFDVTGKHQPDPYIFEDGGKLYLYVTAHDGVEAYSADDLFGVWHYEGIVFSIKGRIEYWAPSVAKINGRYYIYVSSSTDDEFEYMHAAVADSPLGPFKYIGPLKDTKGNPIRAVDGCFLVDDDRLYIYWHSNVSNPENKDVYLMTGTVCAELDPENPCQMITEPVEINRFEPEIEWQRFGENNENKRKFIADV